MNASGEGDKMLVSKLPSLVIVFIDETTLSVLLNLVCIAEIGDVFIVDTDDAFIVGTTDAVVVETDDVFILDTGDVVIVE